MKGLAENFASLISNTFNIYCKNFQVSKIFSKMSSFHKQIFKDGHLVIINKKWNLVFRVVKILRLQANPQNIKIILP